MRTGPVYISHLEDPPGSGLAACCGEPLADLPGHPNPSDRTTPIVACQGCARPRKERT